MDTAIETLDKSTKPSKIDRTPKYTSIDKVFELIAVKGLNYTEAGQILGITGEAVSKLCQRNGIPSKNGLKRKKRSRADLFMAKGDMMVSSIETSEVKKMSVRDRVVSAGILYDKERLERGESTSNVSIQHIEALNTLEAVDAEIDSITKGLPTDTSDDSEIQALEAEMARIKGKNETPENE